MTATLYEVPRTPQNRTSRPPFSHRVTPQNATSLEGTYDRVAAISSLLDAASPRVSQTRKCLTLAVHNDPTYELCYNIQKQYRDRLMQDYPAWLRRLFGVLGRRFPPRCRILLS